MKSNWHRALLASLLMIFSGLAGCLEADSIVEESSDNDSNINSDTGNNTTGNVTVIPDYGTIMTSTYHVAQLVSAIVGPTATVEMMSTSNTPVHDYKPSIQDTVRLANSDVFFYHGLNLEPWVEGTLSTLGDDAPPAYATHTMPTGEVTPDYQSLLVSDLCEQLAEGDRESNTLIAYENLASQLEIHLEKGVQSLTFPGADAASLQGHDHDDDEDHDDHGDHDEHDEEHHGLAILFPDNTTMMFEADHDDLPENASGWNLTTMVMDTNSISFNSTFDSQYGNYVTEIGGFEAPSDWSWYWTLYVWNETGETWDMSNLGIDSVMIEEVEHIAFAPSSSDVSLIPVAEDDHGDHDDHTGHDDHDDHDDHGDHDEHAHAEPEKVIENPAGCPSDTVIAVFHLEEGVHIVEFETNSTDITNFEVAALPMLGGHAHHDHGHGDHGDDHDDHDDHGDEGHDEHGDEGHDNHTDDDHDDHGDEGHDDHGDEGHDNHTDDDHVEYPICHNAESHENMEDTNQSDCETAGNLWMEGAPNDGTLGFLTIHVENEGDYGFALPSYITAHILMGEGGHDDHDDHAGHDDHGDDAHDDHDDHAGHDDHGDDAHDDHDEESSIVADDDEDEFEYDPHSWLDPVAFKSQANLVLNVLIEQFPEGNETFTANAQQFMLELDRIHLGYSNAFGESGNCTTNTVAANHNAYSYLTVRYGIEFVTIHGLDPEGEPSVADITEVIEKINEDEIAVLYIEEYTLRSAVESIVDSTGVEVLYLYTMEMSPTDESDSYLTMMNKNLENLKTGMGCTA